MKAFIASIFAIVVIAVAAYFALETVDMTAESVYQSKHGSVRLDSGSD